jgi:heme-degrading monooxygenase HmoA
MSFVSVTRLRIRSARFVPFFAVHTLRSIKQVKHAPGFKGGSLLADRSWTFWTLTTWDSRDSMRRFMTEGPHAAAMPHLLNWCDEASVVHWDQPGDDLPPWNEADRRMRESGRASKVRFPSRSHSDLSYRKPRITTGGPIWPAKAGSA